MASFNHVNVRTRDIEAMRSFLEDVVGLKPGLRPNFAFAGYWMYDGENAVIHINAFAGDASELGAGSVDHIAFGTFDFDDKLAELEGTGLPVRTAEVPGMPLRQIFVEGPDGVTLELQCPVGGSATDRSLREDLA